MKTLIHKAHDFFFPVLILLLLLMFSALPNVVQAQENLPKQEFKNLIQRLINDGFSQEDIHKIFDNPKVTFDPKGVSLFFIHSESSLDYDQFLSSDSISNARAYMEKHREDLEKAQEEYGVDKTIITAIILVETRLGTYVGNRPILNTLSTMAAIAGKTERESLWNAISDSRRLTKIKFEQKANKKSEWAYKELKALLKFSTQESIDPSTITGSYAGAMGISQFMPSNALTLAKDGNKDGHVNLFTHADAIHSIANYLNHYGWEPSVTRQQAHKILYKYNHSNYYVDTLLKISDKLKG
ncbi:MltB [Desulforapulum autotrophicum HRM2]|uniref:MltB n=1 Tax=Desulforapulum autotrophicum (strain ATCC 43914 / DSM 3382 / VKM B-1955 / HRM2) TaxID=177437 RepID=C0QGP0_DESAH|nr:lytic murein transglycosylase [Desulforapulum autotrophicum]ACN13515.1 MltB [Desulforapulum autotrophicum HRM2]